MKMSKPKLKNPMNKNSREKKFTNEKFANKNFEDKKFHEKNFKSEKFANENFKREKKITNKNFSNKKFSKENFFDENSRTKNLEVAISHLCNAKKIPRDAKNVIAHFDEMVQRVFPMNKKQATKLVENIQTLSHLLTDERASRRIFYMNDIEKISSYVRYFSAWNIFKLATLFANVDENFFAFTDGTIALDIGSGPLTLPIALFLAKENFRSKKIVWYCLDISANALSLGEKIFLEIAKELGFEKVNWKIIRVKGKLGTFIKQKADFVSCANVLNEIFDASENAEQFAKEYAKKIFSYGNEKSKFFFFEPGVPRFANIISLLRDESLQNNMKIFLPCTHEHTCPMNGKNAKRGGKAKWCNFLLPTNDAPFFLKKISREAGFQKLKESFSFLFVKKRNEKESKKQNENEIFRAKKMRVASEEIFLQTGECGFYACTSEGLALAVKKTDAQIFSGDEIIFSKKNESEKIDKKTNAKILYV